MWRLMVVMLIGCGRIDFDPVPGDSRPLDAAPAAFDAPFSTPQRIQELSMASGEDDPSLTFDLLEIYFTSFTPDVLWRATRPTIDDPWSAPQQVVELNAGGDVNNPKVTLDGLAIYFGSTRAGSVNTDIWESTRPDRASAWSAPIRLTGVGTSDRDYEPYVLPDHLTMYFTRDTTGDPAIFRTTRATTTLAFSAGTVVAGLDAVAYDGGPFVTADELGVMFHSTRGGSTTTIYRATRAVVTDPFSTPVPVTELDVSGDEQDPWLSPDRHLLVYSASPTGTPDLYIATR